MPTTRPTTKTPQLLATLLFASFAAACGGGAPYQKIPQITEPDQVHAIQVKSLVIALDVTGDGKGRLLPAEALRLNRLVDDFAVNGNGPLVVITPPSHGMGGDRLADAVAQYSRARGLAKSEVVVQEVADAFGAVNVSFERVYVELPDCGQWWVEPSYNPGNSPHVNFGCATQRNLGMMVANPADLMGPVAEGGVQDTNRSNDAIQLFRTGDIYISEETPGLKAEASQVSQ